MAAALRLLFLSSIIYVHVIYLSAEDESQFIYNGFRGSSLSIDGAASIHPNGLLQLTNDLENQIGHAFYTFPFKNNTLSSNSAQFLSFSTSFVFAIVTKQRYKGHGMAFVISPTNDFRRAVTAQYLGLFNSSNNGDSRNHLLAIKLDIFENAEFNDLDDNHVGININSLTSVESASAAYFSNHEGKNISMQLSSGEPIRIWIDYDGEEKFLNITMAPIMAPRPNRPLLSRYIDLSDIFEDTIYVGFSASTGRITSKQYILGWSFNKKGIAQSLNISSLPQLPFSPGETPWLIPLTVSVGILVVGIAGGAYLYRRKKYEEVCEEWEREYSPQRFSYKTLYIATKGFKEKELLGQGGFGKVYRGKLPSGVEVAVKKVSHDSRQGMREFIAEIVSMKRLRHRNLVQVLGYCRRHGELLLVYDYMPNGSLEKFLFSKQKQTLKWPQRFHIIRGVASALLYLHEEWEQVVLHRDIKSSNVMLDSDLNARLGDFGLARFHDHGTNFDMTGLVGTKGYMAPELFLAGIASSSADVYAFGAFMLEVACGRRPIENSRKHEEIISVEWVVNCWKRGELLGACDPRLEGNYVLGEAELVLKLGLLCQHIIPEARPKMRQVVQYLVGDANLPDLSPNTHGIGASSVRIKESDIIITPDSLMPLDVSSSKGFITHSLFFGGR